MNGTDPSGAFGLLGECPAGSRCSSNGTDTDALKMSIQNQVSQDLDRAAGGIEGGLSQGLNRHCPEIY
ncbi:hypothetical protein, partial [Stenotrophomonas maltophilia]